MTDTVEKIARDFVESLSFDDLKFLRDYPESAKVRDEETRFPVGYYILDSMRRAIRNDYSLWWESPLTKRWREDEASRDIRDGVDYSVDHPDNISAVIFDRAVEITKTEYFKHD